MEAARGAGNVDEGERREGGEGREEGREGSRSAPHRELRSLPFNLPFSSLSSLFSFSFLN